MWEEGVTGITSPTLVDTPMPFYCIGATLEMIYSFGFMFPKKQ